MIIKRGDIYYANLDPTVGSEQNGIRPVLIISNNIGNLHSSIIIVVPISSVMKKEYLPTHIFLNTESLLKNSVLMFEQIRTIDKCRLLQYICTISSDFWDEINVAIKISLGVYP